MIGPVVLLLAGIVIATAVFAATLWALAEAVRHGGATRWVNAAAIAFTLLSMAALSAQNDPAARLAGAGLAVAPLACLIRTPGFTRLLPLAHLAFGAALVAGLPFAG